jgi:hypothetical protein
MNLNSTSEMAASHDFSSLEKDVGGNIILK